MSFEDDEEVVPPKLMKEAKKGERKAKGAKKER